MTALYAGMQILGGLLCAIALVWAWRTRHPRNLWRRARHDTSTVAIVLELEEKVRELEQLTVDAR
ncbi:MAG TPA: hypothetical protein VGP92_15460 [Acidimicrobiia bacterium]|nr:hypothetical protein [Acidimicrobiia bacterium]